jgi:hypothetical protein
MGHADEVQEGVIVGPDFTQYVIQASDMVAAVGEYQAIEKFVFAIEGELQAGAHESAVQVAHVRVRRGYIRTLRGSYPDGEDIGRIQYLLWYIGAEEANHLFTTRFPIING